MDSQGTMKKPVQASDRRWNRAYAGQTEESDCLCTAVSFITSFVRPRTSKIRINVQVPRELGETRRTGTDTHFVQQILEDCIM